MLTRDDGAAVVEFVLVGVLVVTLFLGVMQVGLTLHVRNVVVASLAEGAREAANADRGCADGTARAYDLVRNAVGQRIADGLAFTCAVGACGCSVASPETGDATSGETVAVRARGTLPLVFPPVGSVPFDATAHAFDEG